MRGLGHVFDFCTGITPVADLAAGANTGARIHMRNYDELAVVFFKNAASAGTDTITLTLQEHNAATGGTSQNCVCITDWYQKSEATLDGDEVWVEATQAAAATLALTNALVPAASQAYVVFSVASQSLSAGFEWLSVNIADPGSGGTILGGLFYIPTGLKIRLRPDRLAQPNA